MDLDGRAHLNVRAASRGRDPLGLPLHVSNQGWGPWEVNLRHVLPGKVGGVDEWPNLLLGGNGRPGRYGADFWPGAAGGQAPAGRPYHSYAQADFDACR